MSGNHFESAQTEHGTSKESFEELLKRRAEESLDLEGFVSNLTTLGSQLSSQFEALGRVEDLEKALSCQHFALKLVSSLNPELPNLLNNLGNSYQRRFIRFKEDADFNQAIDYFNRSVSLIPNGHPSKSGILNNLGSLHMRRFHQQKDVSQLDEALGFLNQAASLSPDRDVHKPGILHNLGKSYIERFKVQGKLEDLKRCLELLRQALPLCADEYQLKPTVLAALSSAYKAMFEKLDNLGALEKSIMYSNEAVMLTPIGQPERPNLLNELGLLYDTRFGRRGKVEDINNSVNCFVQAVSLCVNDGQQKSWCLNNLGNACQNRFNLIGQIQDINDAIKYQSQAVASLSDSDTVKPLGLNNLGNSYFSRFQTTGDIADLDQSIHYLRLAVGLIPDGHRKRLGALYNLGNAYRFRYDRLQDIPDMSKAIDYLSKVTLLTPDDDFRKPWRLNSLGMAYQSRFRCLGEVLDLTNAVDCLSRANSLTPDDHAEKPRTLSNLGIAHTMRFEYRGDCLDIDQGIKYLKESMTLASSAPSTESSRLALLGKSYLTRFRRFGNLADATEAIQSYSKAVLRVPDGHTNKASLLLDLGVSYICPAELSYPISTEAVRAAIACFQQAAQSPTGNPRIRFAAARTWSTTQFPGNDSRILGYQRTIELLPELIWLGTTITERYKLITQVGDVSREAASFAISLGSYNKALEWLEEGRSIVWNQILRLRSPLEELSSADAGLAARLEAVSRQLEEAGTRASSEDLLSSSEPNLERDAEHHRRLAHQRDELLKEARKITGFESYMRPRTADELMSAVKDKVAVILNIHTSRCDALIIRPHADEISHIPLQSFSHAKALDARIQLASLIGHRGDRARGFKRAQSGFDSVEAFKAMLAALWFGVAQPVLEYLGYTNERSTEELPCIAWCTTGPLSFLPLHAAGCYDGCQPNVSDLVVSSYIPTITTLLNSKAQMSSTHHGILAVGQEHTSGFGDLPSTTLELAEISKQAKLREVPVLQLDGDNAKVDTVVQGMNEYGSVHLACHASQRVDDPTQSAFHLSDGSLTLAALTKQRFKAKGLAFLSACSTATGDENLPDEAVHLAAGMLMAGYPSVVATMWSICDEDAPEVSQLVYADLIKDGQIEYRKADRALHNAVKDLRNKIGETSFVRWVPFIHMGV